MSAFAQKNARFRAEATPRDLRLGGVRPVPGDFVGVTQARMVLDVWGSPVPGSGADDCMMLGAMSAAEVRGHDVSGLSDDFDRLLALSVDERRRGAIEASPRLVVDTWELLGRAAQAPLLAGHPSAQSPRPLRWEFPAAKERGSGRESRADRRDRGARREQIRRAWVGQVAGGAFGTALEGCTGAALARVYGSWIDSYVAPPDPLNDDVVYELVLLDALARGGRSTTTADIAAEWVSAVPFGWSAEWVALENLRSGITPPDSATAHNPMSEWIGAQMRAMVCGLVHPGDPVEAAKLAITDAEVSHTGNGVYGAVFSAVLSALSFLDFDLRSLIVEAARYVPSGSEYAEVVRRAVHVCASSSSHAEAWNVLASHLRAYDWVHAYPNIAAVVCSLWFGAGDFSASMAILGGCGLDVDCNAGLVGTVLGVRSEVPDVWAAPFATSFSTYLPGAPVVRIDDLVELTLSVSDQLTVEAA